MIKNYFKIAWRNLLRQKAYSAINIIGLATGISACLLIFLFVQHELSYEKHFAKADRTYRVVNDLIVDDEIEKASLTTGGLAPALKADYPEVESAVRLVNGDKQAVSVSDDKVFYLNNSYFADSTFFSVFDYEFQSGDPATALAAPFSMVLTQATAEKLFGSAAAAQGQLVKIQGESFKVTGVLAPSGPSHLTPDFYASLSSLGNEFMQMMEGEWGNTNTYTYVVLRNPSQMASLQAKMGDLFQRRVKPAYDQMQSTGRVDYKIQPLTDVHLTNDWLYELSPSGNRSYIFIFSAVAIFVLLIASINYMNLATARSAKRAKEVGLRKVVGAHRSQLVGQFLGESLVITLLAVLLALALVELLLPTFNGLTNKDIGSSYLLNPVFGLTLLGIILLIGLVAGSYPAFFLSGFKPVDVLKSDKAPRGSGATLRKGLVILQFTISLVLIIGTVVVYSQMDFLKKADLGFNKEQVAVIDIPSGDTTLTAKLPLIKSELLANPNVTQVSASAQIPGQGAGVLIFMVERNNAMVEKTMNMMTVDYDFLELMGIKLKAGRNFSQDMGTDQSAGFIINEAAANLLGWPDAVGKRIGFSDTTSGKVIGVVKDFNYTSLHDKIAPVVLRVRPRTSGYLLARLSGDNFEEALAHVKTTWARFDPNRPIDLTFLDESFNQQYQSEEKMLKIFGYFSILTIMIACMGLFGLTSFMAEQRTREIGIRKVLGSSVMGIVMLLTKDFALLVVIAIVLASPLAWYGMQKWLQEFAYRVPLSPWLFVGAAVVALAIAVATVSVQAAKAALLDPIKALRSE
ncbi:ABC transporter permease [Rufibacter hautae]|uniref:FtsX-like permease family protein n=1 Tax=Rufibacter hautae TaxID=2595005 RepID=A0A5B6TEB4_9BACT|nr:ABC transporter permease [Rufibacter hautae]KAA3437522.1 FtsX-like permease family protein [Rufibacter hautae]